MLVRLNKVDKNQFVEGQNQKKPHSLIGHNSQVRYSYQFKVLNLEMAVFREKRNQKLR